ncbi:MAG TPA: 50S ribosomal protein L16 [Tepidisphaeraceae bacterium]
MPLMPKRVKFRKSQRGKMKGNATRGNTVAFGEYGLMTLEAGWITARQIEAARVAASHFLHREGRLFIRIFPHKPVSAKPLETRMGKGKGEPEFWVAIVKPGTVMFEVTGVDDITAKKCLARLAHKLPVQTRFVERRHAVA